MDVFGEVCHILNAKQDMHLTSHCLWNCQVLQCHVLGLDSLYLCSGLRQVHKWGVRGDLVNFYLDQDLSLAACCHGLACPTIASVHGGCTHSPQVV